MIASRPDAPRNPPAESRPGAAPSGAIRRPDTAGLPRPADDRQRQRFENLLSRQERPGARHGDEDESSSGDDASAWGLASPQQHQHALGSADDQGGACTGDDNDGPTPDAIASPFADLPPAAFNTAPPAVADIQVPAPVFHVTEPQQARLYAHLALPLAPQGNAMGRFEVLNPSAASGVEHVEVNTLPQGGLTVAIGTSVQHAGLMDRHLPQLQRRLADKGSAAHLRVQESDAERD
jgi:hypothetical protein